MLKIGDKIKDTEDTDCYFVGEVVKLNIFGGVEYYKVTQIIWNGEDPIPSEWNLLPNNDGQLQIGMQLVAGEWQYQKFENNDDD